MIWLLVGIVVGFVGRDLHLRWLYHRRIREPEPKVEIGSRVVVGREESC